MTATWTPTAGAKVTCEGRDEVWTVADFEDDDTVWLTALAPTAAGTFAAWLDSTSPEVLAEVSEIRPAFGGAL